MKKLFLLFFVVVATLVSCEGEMGPAGLPGPEGVEGPQGPPGYGTGWDVQFIEVLASEWEDISGNDEIRYRYTFVPEIYGELNLRERESIYNDGSVNLYMFLEYDTEYETQRALPYIENWINAENETQLISYTYDYNTEDIAIYFTFSGDDWQMPQSLWFRVVMNWQ